MYSSVFTRIAQVWKNSSSTDNFVPVRRKEVLGNEGKESFSFVLYIFLSLLICILFTVNTNPCITHVSYK